MSVGVLRPILLIILRTSVSDRSGNIFVNLYTCNSEVYNFEQIKAFLCTKVFAKVALDFVQDLTLFTRLLYPVHSAHFELIHLSVDIFLHSVHEHNHNLPSRTMRVKTSLPNDFSGRHFSHTSDKFLKGKKFSCRHSSHLK